MQKKPVFLNIIIERTEKVSLVFQLGKQVIITTSSFLFLQQPPFTKHGRNIKIIFDDFDLVTRLLLRKSLSSL